VPVYVLEIKGRAIAAMNAESAREADARFRGESLGVDLMNLEDEDGNPIWSGHADEIAMREASPEETATWQVAHSAALASGEIDAPEDEWLVYLIPTREA
jgi:hypothetical protein